MPVMRAVAQGVLFAILLAGCGNEEMPKEAVQERALVAVSVGERLPTLAPRLRKRLREQDLKLSLMEAGGRATAQARQVSQLLAEHPQVLVLCPPLSPQLLRSVWLRTEQEGPPVVNVLQGREMGAGFVPGPAAELVADLARVAADRLSRQGVIEPRVAVVETAGWSTLTGRSNLFLDTLEEQFESIRLLSRVQAQRTQFDSQTLAAVPGADLIFCADLFATDQVWNLRTQWSNTPGPILAGLGSNADLLADVESGGGREVLVGCSVESLAAAIVQAAQQTVIAEERDVEPTANDS
jgi:hypothetical protein